RKTRNIRKENNREGKKKNGEPKNPLTRGRQSIILDPNLRTKKFYRKGTQGFRGTSDLWSAYTKGRRIGGQPSGLLPSFVFFVHLRG
ncbi:MAG: hypothetical protein LBQ88_02325, partial [Treponema sp.]|nr:hypothetical protein [Treponema sp.]